MTGWGRAQPHRRGQECTCQGPRERVDDRPHRAIEIDQKPQLNSEVQQHEEVESIRKRSRWGRGRERFRQLRQRNTSSGATACTHDTKKRE